MSAPSHSPRCSANDPAVIAHLGTLQTIISRLANNSAQCKAWCLTLVTALIAFASAAHTISAIRIVILPVTMFLVLDAAYLGAEKAYRDLYNVAVEDIRHQRYTLEHVFAAGARLTIPNWLRSLKSWSIWVFYYPLIIAYVYTVRISGLAAMLTASSK